MNSITTKFLPGDKAFRLYNNKVQEVMIEEVTINLSADLTKFSECIVAVSCQFKEWGHIPEPDDHKYAYTFTLDQSELFATKEELLASL